MTTKLQEQERDLIQGTFATLTIDIDGEAPASYAFEVKIGNSLRKPPGVHDFLTLREIGISKIKYDIEDYINWVETFNVSYPPTVRMPPSLGGWKKQHLLDITKLVNQLTTLDHIDFTQGRFLVVRNLAKTPIDVTFS